MAIDRRHFLNAAGPALLFTGAPPKPRPARAAEVTPTEDLMREHGVLKRVLLIYDEVRRPTTSRRTTSRAWVRTIPFRRRSSNSTRAGSWRAARGR